MILYFSGTGNSLAIARQIADRTGEQVMSLYDAVNKDLTHENVIGFIYPTYYYNAPVPVKELVKKLKLSAKSYIFIIIPCGAQTGNAIYDISKILANRGISVDYCHKVRVPDCSAIGFGRNPNDQTWKFKKYAKRVEQIIVDINARRHAHHFSSWGIAGWLCNLKSVKNKTLPLLQPAVNADKCIGCNTCAKVCPQGNIKLIPTDNKNDNQKAYIGNNCAQCLSCVHFCPQQAIEIAGKPTIKAHQYHHPQIKLKDMIS